MLERMLIVVALAVALPAPAAEAGQDPMRIPPRCVDGQALVRTPEGLPVVVGACSEQPEGSTPGETGLPAPPEPADCLVPGYDDRCEAWTAPRFDGPWGGPDYPGFGSFDRRDTVAAHPSEDLVFVGGTASPPGGGVPDADWVLIAYRASTGVPVWTTLYEGVGELTLAYLFDISLSPDGSRIYVVGDAAQPDTFNYRSVVAAFDSSTGDPLWSGVAPNGAEEAVAAMTTLPDETVEERLFLVGTAAGTSPGGAVVGVGGMAAVDPDDGSTIWTSRVPAVTERGSRFNKMVVAPDGSAVYAAGGDHLPDGLASNFLVAGFDAVDGSVVWQVRDERTQPASGNNGVTGMAITPDGSRVLVSGFDTFHTGSLIEGSSSGILTIAHETSDGAEAWRKTFLGPPGSDKDFYFSLFQGMLAISPDGRTAVAVGAINSNSGIGTVAYDVATGAERWGVLSDEPLHQYVFVNHLGYYPRVVANGDRAFVSNRRGFGASQYRTVTMAYDLDAGTLDWTGRLGVNRTLFGGSELTPDGKRVIVTAADQAVHPGSPAPNPGVDSVDIVTVSYQA